MGKIIISDLTKMAMTDNDGLKLRREIEKHLEEDKIILDFADIEVFATMFFNASLGHFVMNLTPEKCDELFEIVNISELGQETLDHSLENAKLIFNNKLDSKEIAEITTKNIDEY